MVQMGLFDSFFTSVSPCGDLEATITQMKMNREKKASDEELQSLHVKMENVCKKIKEEAVEMSRSGSLASFSEARRQSSDGRMGKCMEELLTSQLLSKVTHLCLVKKQNTSMLLARFLIGLINASNQSLLMYQEAVIAINRCFEVFSKAKQKKKNARMQDSMGNRMEDASDKKGSNATQKGGNFTRTSSTRESGNKPQPQKIALTNKDGKLLARLARAVIKLVVNEDDALINLLFVSDAKGMESHSKHSSSNGIAGKKGKMHQTTTTATFYLFDTLVNLIDKDFKLGEDLHSTLKHCCRISKHHRDLERFIHSKRNVEKVLAKRIARDLLAAPQDLPSLPNSAWILSETSIAKELPSIVTLLNDVSLCWAVYTSSGATIRDELVSQLRIHVVEGVLLPNIHSQSNLAKAATFTAYMDLLIRTTAVYEKDNPIQGQRHDRSPAHPPSFTSHPLKSSFLAHTLPPAPFDILSSVHQKTAEANIYDDPSQQPQQPQPRSLEFNPICSLFVSACLCSSFQHHHTWKVLVGRMNGSLPLKPNSNSMVSRAPFVQQTTLALLTTLFDLNSQRVFYLAFVQHLSSKALPYTHGKLTQQEQPSCSKEMVDDRVLLCNVSKDFTGELGRPQDNSAPTSISALDNGQSYTFSCPVKQVFGLHEASGMEATNYLLKLCSSTHSSSPNQQPFSEYVERARERMQQVGEAHIIAPPTALPSKDFLTCGSNPDTKTKDSCCSPSTCISHQCVHWGESGSCNCVHVFIPSLSALIAQFMDLPLRVQLFSSKLITTMACLTHAFIVPYVRHYLFEVAADDAYAHQLECLVAMSPPHVKQSGAMDPLLVSKQDSYGVAPLVVDADDDNDEPLNCSQLSSSSSWLQIISLADENEMQEENMGNLGEGDGRGFHMGNPPIAMVDGKDTINKSSTLVLLTTVLRKVSRDVQEMMDRDPLLFAEVQRFYDQKDQRLVIETTPSTMPPFSSSSLSARRLATATSSKTRTGSEDAIQYRSLMDYDAMSEFSVMTQDIGVGFQPSPNKKSSSSMPSLKPSSHATVWDHSSIIDGVSRNFQSEPSGFVNSSMARFTQSLSQGEQRTVIFEEAQEEDSDSRKHEAKMVMVRKGNSERECASTGSTSTTTTPSVCEHDCNENANMGVDNKEKERRRVALSVVFFDEFLKELAAYGLHHSLFLISSNS
eukprot:m.49062 g.49062  ORF g.49062 m.49062 type:complete len:1180 (-) comp7430_c1_seq1:383-3922(-)